MDAQLYTRDHHELREEAHRPPPSDLAKALERIAVGLGLPALGVGVVTATMAPFRDHFDNTTAALSYLLVVLLIAVGWASGPALVASVLGALAFNYFFLPPTGALTPGDPQNWVVLTAYLVTALVVGQLSGQAERRAAEARTSARLRAALADIGEQALGAEHHDTLIDSAVALIGTTLGVDYCEVFVVLPSGKAVLRHGVGWDTRLLGRATIDCRPDSQMNFTLLAGAPVVVEDLRTETRFRVSRLLRSRRVVSGVDVVIDTPEGPFGVLGAHTTRWREFSREEIDFLQSIANMLGTAIARGRYLEALRASEQSLNQAQELAHLGSWRLDVHHNQLHWSDEVFRIFGVKPKTAMTYEAFLEFIHPDDRWRVDEAWQGAMRGLPYDVEHRIVVDGEIKWVRERAHLTFDDAGSAVEGVGTVQDITQRKTAEEEIRSFNADLERRVTVRTAQLRAAREREAETGGKIQRMLLLDEPPRDVRGLSIAALTVPSHKVAGDFYGFFWHEANDCLDVLVADVMGKGVPAALLGAATKSHFPDALWHLLASSSEGSLPAPKEVVTLAHTHMARRLIGLDSFVTSCYARFDVANRRLDLVDCGHTGALILRAGTGECSIVHGDNLPLGVREGEIYDQLTVPLNVGDVVLFFSDGVTEARNAQGELFGPERLVECVRRNAGADPEVLVAAVRAAAEAFTGAQALTDDLTCLVVRLVPHEPPFARADLEIKSALGELRRARSFVESFCAARLAPPLDPPGLASLVLAVNEVACNIMKHAYRGHEDQRIELSLEAFRDRVIVRLRHLGVPFDPSAVPLPDFDGSRESGFGVFLVAQSVDAVRYYRDDLDRNCIDLEKRRGVSAA